VIPLRYADNVFFKCDNDITTFRYVATLHYNMDSTPEMLPRVHSYTGLGNHPSEHIRDIEQTTANIPTTELRSTPHVNVD
jgi:hypothetical protein